MLSIYHISITPPTAYHDCGVAVMTGAGYNHEKLLVN